VFVHISAAEKAGYDGLAEGVKVSSERRASPAHAATVITGGDLVPEITSC
jgi:cold shock CspA family protein